MKMILGPCAIENMEHALASAHFLKKLQDDIIQMGYEDFEIIYKSSYSKANRTQLSSFHGVGLERGLVILEEVKRQTGLRVTSDVHSVEEIAKAKKVLDIIQIPHQMCRNTDLLEAAGNSKRIVSVKKGSFMAPEDFQFVVEKIRSTGNGQEIIAIERGNTFGYKNTVVDMRNFAILNRRRLNKYEQSISHELHPGSVTRYGVRNSSVRLCIDASHPSCDGALAPLLAKAAVAAGADMVFLETHACPEAAPCDGNCMVPFDQLKFLILQLLQIQSIVQKNPHDLKGEHYV